MENQNETQQTATTINGITPINGKSFDTTTASELLEMEFEPLGFAVKPILPQGLILLGGGGKIGKSWMVIDIGISVSSGRDFWDFATEQGEVLYLALEDNHRRLHARLRSLEAENEDVSRFHLTTASYGISSGLLEQIHSFLALYPNTKLIIIDTLERIRDTEQDKSMYSCDYRDMTALREITDKYKLTLLLVHHTRKMYDPDPLNTLSGSTGLIGSVDGVFVLDKYKRIGKEAKLTIVNRDTDSYCFKLEFDSENCKWVFLGDDDGNGGNDNLFCNLVDDFLEESWRGTATELCEALNNMGSDCCVNPLTISKQLKSNLTALEMKYNISVSFERNRDNREIYLTKRTMSKLD